MGVASRPVSVNQFCETSIIPGSWRIRRATGRQCFLLRSLLQTPASQHGASILPYQLTMRRCDEFTDFSNKDAPVRGYLHRSMDSGADCLILTHGAGSNCQSPLLTALADAFCFAGLTVFRCDLPFRQSRPHGPPPRGGAGKDQEGLRRP